MDSRVGLIATVAAVIYAAREHAWLTADGLEPPEITNAITKAVDIIDTVEANERARKDAYFAELAQKAKANPRIAL